ncbi:indole-3-glycerol phosphate synthase TrpC [Desulfomonile tiedjei]|uniref:Indole-3-glycerol phosphate synthase n=1 Tax=Desulfomonile tiedjei (strain ATCC 49306 / DSM 6799 / DCB-1) TaxID=706587 RepID=I4CB11_DESTA|nr:indole-3-glycerol phosphate synthase TrpC [Desulfomonile tiedjei]AFM26752.1 Indole-3-glycerol phosphate synthase [Desulfomonile tiedjei DSM 6799]
MSGFLQKIVKIKAERLALQIAHANAGALEAQARLASPPKAFLDAFRGPGIHIIAEIKRASPSKGLLNADLEPASLARTYASGGACAISVLTEEDHFRGSLSDLKEVRRAVPLPILRKDFILEPFQIFEARLAGADSILLIAAVLDEGTLKSLIELSRSMAMEPLVEIHDKYELSMALNVGAGLIGINNRDLRTFGTDLNVTVKLAGLIPSDRTIISESGIRTHQDISRLRDAGVHGFLIGETLVKSPDPEAALQELLHA